MPFVVTWGVGGSIGFLPAFVGNFWSTPIKASPWVAQRRGSAGSLLYMCMCVCTISRAGRPCPSGRAERDGSLSRSLVCILPDRGGMQAWLFLGCLFSFPKNNSASKTSISPWLCTAQSCFAALGFLPELREFRMLVQI